MKKADIAMTVLIAAIGVFIAYTVAINLSFLKLPEDGVKVKTIQEISPDVTDPSSDVFNNEAINPTVEVFVSGREG